MRWPHVVGAAFLGLQLGAIVHARFVPERFFCWAPYDQHTRFAIEVEVDGRRLSREEVARRYRYRSDGWEPRAIANVFAIVRGYESNYGTDDRARVVVHYAVNGRPEATWRWPDG